MQALECRLRQHVETHDLEGLRRAMEGVDIGSALDPCQPIIPSKGNSMRLYLKENESIVERVCLLGHLDMLEMFLHHGCSSNLPTSHGRLIHTVLTSLKIHHHLVECGLALATVRLLLALDCDVNVKSYQGKSPLLLAAELADAPIMAEILARCLPWQLTCPERDKGHTPLHMACMNGSVPCVRLLLEALPCGEGVNAVVNTRDCVNISPLLCSLMVMKHNISFHKTDCDGDGGTDKVVTKMQYGHFAIVEMLLDRGAVPKEATFPIPVPLSDRYYYESSYLYGPNEQPAYRSILQTVLEIANQYEVHSMGVSLKPGDEPDLTGKKISSLYGELVRMLVHKCEQLSPLPSNELEVWEKGHPHIKKLLLEIDAFLKERELKPRTVPKLLSLCRDLIRLQAAKADSLLELESLPLPRKVKDYVRFVDLTDL